MITIRDWVATIPDAEKHIAYVGENDAETRTFLLTGAEWGTYRNWGFYLDMAFDLSTVTIRDNRQVVTTQEDTTENIAETLVKTTTTGKKETYTVENVTVNTPSKTDIAYLSKQVVSEGLQLTWKVLSQHTQLPGKLTATLRAKGPNNEVKKSALMVFEVDPAVTATPAAAVTQSVQEQILNEMSVLCQQGYVYADAAATSAQTAQQMAQQAAASEQTCAELAQEVAHDAGAAEAAASIAATAQQTATSSAQQAQTAADTATAQAAVAMNCSATARGAALQMQYLKDVVECFTFGKNLYNPETANRGYRLSLGRLIEDAEHITSDYIPYQPVDGSCTYCFSADGIGEDTQVMVALYDASLTFIKQMARPATEVIDIEDYEWTYSDGEKRRIAYLRLSFPIALTNVQFEVGDTATAYEPYRSPIVKGENVQTDAKLDGNSTNPVQNKVVTQEAYRINTGILNAYNTATTAQKSADKAQETATSAGSLAQASRYTLDQYVIPHLTDLETSLGDIDTALDSIIAIQESLIGGDGV